MNAAMIERSGATPVYGPFADPRADEGGVLIEVQAAALSHLTKSRAAGTHYSNGSGQNFVPGVDGVGTLAGGRRFYFFLPEAPHGSMAERSVVDPRRCIELPEGVSDVTAAAIAIPGMSSWAALKERAKFEPGGTVLVNGATGASGGLAVQVAKRLGAGKVIATGRNAKALARLGALGADVTISLQQALDGLRQAFEDQFRSGVDVVLDYLWGPSAEALLASAVRASPDGVPMRFVQIGAVSGAEITLPSAVLRSSMIELLGSGLNSVPMPRLKDAITQLFASAAENAFELAVQAVPLQRVGELWDRAEALPRIVFTMG